MRRSVKILLQFPNEPVKPFVHLFAVDFDLVCSIYQADITPGSGGRMVLDLSGESENIDKALVFAEKNGVKVRVMSKAIRWDTETCVHCGACTAVCQHKALSLDPVTAELSFNNDNCILCEMCIKACPTGAVSLDIYQ